ncbi:MAG TPA: SH3 domain-containing protein [Candidatus Acidoferrum sp.]
MRHKLLVLGTFAGLAVTLPSLAAENSGSATAPAPGGLHGTVVCRGVENVPVTADAEQGLPMQLVARLNCGDEVAVLSDSEGYTVNIRTADGQDGYVARMYLSERPANSAKDRRAVEAVVDNGIARWQSGAPGSDQFFSGGSVVESLTANGITVQVSLQDTGWKLRASVAIANEGSVPVHYNPAGFTLDELKPRLRTLAYQNPRELAKALTHQVYWTNSSATAPASATYMNAAYKTSAYVPSTPNYLADVAQQVQSAVLLQGNVGPKEKASGVVWFERDKSPQQLNLRIFVGDQIFEFPLSFPQH